MFWAAPNFYYFRGRSDWRTVIHMVENRPKYHAALSKNIIIIFLFASKLALFWSVLPYELQENLAKSDQQSLYYSVPLKFRFNSMQLTLPNTKKVNLDPPFSMCVNSDFCYLLLCRFQYRNTESKRLMNCSSSCIWPVFNFIIVTMNDYPGHLLKTTFNRP